MRLHSGEHWAGYNDDQGERQPRALLRQMLTLAGVGAGRGAIDLGCGAGIETRVLLQAGWNVHAIDGAPGTRQRVFRTTEGTDQSRLTVDVTDFRCLVALPAADLVYSGYSLPYVRPDDFARVWEIVRTSLRPGAWLAVNLFGEHDSWANDPDGTFLSEAQVRLLLTGLDVVSFTEEDQDGPAYSGPKHWHVFDVIARAPR